MPVCYDTGQADQRMMKLIHLSDLHFGTEDLRVVTMLEETINSLQPNLIVISGDFTQRARKREFYHARDLIARLKAPCFCVPGNHDVPPVDLMQRFTNPYKRYRHFICDDLEPFWENEEIVIAGVNSARRMLPHWNWANGAISLKQTERLAGLFDPAEPRWTICTFHHPAHKVDDMPLDVTVFGKKRAMQVIHDLKIDLVLTGHVHHASITTKGDDAHQSVYLSASTALSSRLRGQENGFNVITLEEDVMTIEILKLGTQGFEATDRFTHKRR